MSKFTFTKHFFFPGLPNLGAQIRCAQNWYPAVQTHLKYPLAGHYLDLPCGNFNYRNKKMFRNKKKTENI